MTGKATPRPADPTESGKAAADVVRSRAAWAWTGVGYGFFLLGLLGMALPVLPTTIFWIIAAACFAKSCPAMQRRIFAWPVVGPAVERFLLHGVIAPQSKRAAYLGMGLAAAILAFFSPSVLITALGLALILAGALYILTRPSTIPAAERS